MIAPLRTLMSATRLIRASALLCILSTLTGCGAGIVATVLAGDSSSSSNPPTLRPIGAASGPLVPEANQLLLRDLVINNYLAPANATISVQLRALGAVAEQVRPVVQTGAENSTTVTYLYNTDKILEKVADPTAADIPAQLVVLADGEQVAEPQPFLLRRQPTVEIVLPQGQNPPALLSTLGTSRLKLRVDSLGDFEPQDLEGFLQMQVAVFDPQGNTVNVRSATQLKVTDTGDVTGDRFVEATPPASTFPTVAFVFLTSAQTGRTTFSSFFYRPQVGLVVPPAGSLDGGTLVTLTGRGLVPLDFTNPSNPKLDFSRIDLRVRKGEREFPVPERLLRVDLSSGDRLTFTMPPSPDGAPGPAQIVLEVVLTSGARVLAEPVGTFSYGAGAVSFGPRGVLLPGKPIRVKAGRLISTIGGTEDLGALFSNAGLGQVQPFQSLNNGLFARAGAPFDADSGQDQLQRVPADLCIADLDRDGRNDLFILNKGSNSTARHSILMSQIGPSPFFVPAPTALDGSADAGQCLTVDVDNDRNQDVLVLFDFVRPPALYLSMGSGQPSFEEKPFTSQSGLYDYAEAADLDSDGDQDIVLAQRLVLQGTPSKSFVRVSVFAGPTNGNANPTQDLLVTVPGHVASSKSRVVGIHAIGPEPEKALVLVLEGDPNDSATPPTITLLRPNKSGYQQPTPSDTLNFPASHPGIAASVAGQLEAGGSHELAVASKDGATKPLRLFQWSQNTLREIIDGVDPGTEPIRKISELRIATAVPPELSGNNVARPSLLVVHESEVDGVADNRISSLIADAGPKLRSPDAFTAFPTRVEHLVLGNFDSTTPIRFGSGLDAFVVGTDTLQLATNDGLGTLSAGAKTTVPQLVEPSVTTSSLYQNLDGVDTAVFLTSGTSGARVAFLDPGNKSVVFGADDLRKFAPQALRSRPVHPDSHLAELDVDNDGTPDLVVLLNLREIGKPPKEGDAVILFLRGRPNRTRGTFPLDMPDVPVGGGTSTHGGVTSIVLGDFAFGDLRPEIAAAIPRGETGSGPDGNHIRFYNFTDKDQKTKGLRFEESFTSATNRYLLAGTEPRRLAAADFDNNGTLDLAVAGGEEVSPKLRILFNTAPLQTTNPGKVDISRFNENTSNPLALPPGQPHHLTVEDTNGNLLPDLIVAVRDSGPGLRYSIGHYLNPSVVDGVRSQILPPSRTGTLIPQGSSKVSRNALMSMAVGDMNGDERPDIVVGWDTAGAGDLNLRVLLSSHR